MKKPVIAVSGSSKPDPQGKHRFGLHTDYLEAVSFVGAIPLIPFNKAELDDVRFLAENHDGLILTGGPDINPVCYRSTPHPLTINIDNLRDTFELGLIDQFVRLQKPILGICRGTQLLNVFFGGTLFQDIESELGISHPFNSEHYVVCDMRNTLTELFGNKFFVNSLHHQAIAELGQDLRVLVRSENSNLVEAFEHKSLPIIGVQWHPERMVLLEQASKLTNMKLLFEKFINLI